MNPEERRVRASERLKMTQAEKWLTKQKPKPATTFGDMPFNEQLRSRKAKIGEI